MTEKRFVDVLVNRPVDGPFTYSVPEGLEAALNIGALVEVSFGSKRLFGYVVGISSKTNVKNVKPVIKVVDSVPLIDDEILRLTKWISEYYYSSWGEALSAAIPSALKKISKTSRPHKKTIKDEEIIFEDGSDRHLVPTPEQKEALDLIKSSIDKKTHRVFLLYGVTGSGKTEVYLQAVDYAFQKGFSSIILVPEISLTPQTVARFRARFGDRIAILHSRLRETRRAYEWKRIASGEARIVVGARSAIFAPVKNLGLIVVDEEHETSYKQEETPRYNARDVAVKRAELTNGVVILGSATPSLESFYAATQGQYTLIELSERIDYRLLPEVEIVDMREELHREKKFPILSNTLKNWMEKDIGENKQVIIFLNRRGFSTFINCRKCGYVITCKRCNVSLTYHYHTRQLICHHCNYKMSPPEICPSCNSTYLKYWGLGTEKVENEIHRLFPQARIARLDTDAARGYGAHERVLSMFKEQKIDILVGTQMIAKGLDFPQVTLVGVISADTALNLPDFRAGERTFNLLTQVGGRAGRGDLGGRVIIQTYAPGHYAIQAARNHDYRSFYAKEISFRKELNLPPFSHIVRVMLRGRNEEKVVDFAEALRVKLVKRIKALDKDIEIVGPAPAPISRLKGLYHWHLFLKSKRAEDAVGLLKEILDNQRRKKGVIITVDVDPY